MIVRRIAWFIPLLLVALIAGCGGPATTTTTTTHTCNPVDTTLNCNLPPPPKIISAPLQTQKIVAHGIDFGWGGPSVGTMKANGWSFAFSYLSFDFSKNWHVQQAREYQRAGISTGFVWETTATRALDGCGAGAADAGSAWNLGHGLGARVIYFAVDFELQPSEYNIVKSYFACADHVLTVRRVGAYGGYSTVNVLFNAHLINYGWQTYAWSGGHWDGRAQLQQYLNGSSVDYDRAVHQDYGQNPCVGCFLPKPKPHPQPKPVSQQERELRALLGAYDKRTNPHGHNCAHPPYKHAYPSVKYDHACAVWAAKLKVLTH